jgi:hypothetical protein
VNVDEALEHAEASWLSWPGVLAAEVRRLRTANADLVDQAELTCAVIERVLDADASEGTPIWEWTDDEAETGVREVLAVADQLMSALDRVHATDGSA